MGLWFRKHRGEVIRCAVLYLLCLALVVLFFTVSVRPSGSPTAGDAFPAFAAWDPQDQDQPWRTFHDQYNRTDTVVYEPATDKYLVFGPWYAYEGYFVLPSGEDLMALSDQEIQKILVPKQ